MFYGGYGLHGRSSSQQQFLMIGDDERYDLAVCIASYLAHETACPNVNLLHLSSRKAFEAALAMQGAFPYVNFAREVTVGPLLLDVDSPAGAHAKVNPPIRPREDVEYLWGMVLDRKVDWICSDHACCASELKTPPGSGGDIWLAKSGFGGTEYLLSGVLSEGRKRGMSYGHMAELLCWNPARRFGLFQKGDVAPGYDADFVLVDPDEWFVVRAAGSPSHQGYTPFEGQRLTGDGLGAAGARARARIEYPSPDGKGVIPVMVTYLWDPDGYYVELNKILGTPAGVKPGGQ